jgi:hypothetical protein
VEVGGREGGAKMRVVYKGRAARAREIREAEARQLQAIREFLLEVVSGLRIEKLSIEVARRPESK